MGEWKSKAEELGKPVIGAPTLFSEVIRSLLQDYSRGNFKYSPQSKNLGMRILRAPSVHVPMYFATMTFMKEQFEGVDSLQPDEVMQLHKPLELAVLLINLYMYRKARKACPEEEWPHINELYLEQMEIGGYFGYAIPDIGPAYGLLVGGLRPLAFSAFARADESHFKRYRRSLRGRNILYDPKQEQEIFGCTHIDLAAYFMQQLGFGVAMTKSFYEALNDAQLHEDEITGDFARFSASFSWINSLVLTNNIPSFELDDPDKDEKAITKLLNQVKELKEQGSQFAWPEKKPEEYPHPEELLTVKASKRTKAPTKIIETAEDLTAPSMASTDLEASNAEVASALDDDIPEDIAREFGLIK